MTNFKVKFETYKSTYPIVSEIPKETVKLPATGECSLIPEKQISSKDFKVILNYRYMYLGDKIRSFFV